MAERVFITGVGMISAIGNNVQENLRHLRARKSGLGYTRHIDTIHKAVLPVGEVSADTPALAAMAGVKDTPGYTRTTLLGLVAIKEALQSAGIKDARELPTAFINASTVGGMCDTEKVY